MLLLRGAAERPIRSKRDRRLGRRGETTQSVLASPSSAFPAPPPSGGGIRRGLSHGALPGWPGISLDSRTASPAGPHQLLSNRACQRHSSCSNQRGDCTRAGVPEGSGTTRGGRPGRADQAKGSAMAWKQGQYVSGLTLSSITITDSVRPCHLATTSAGSLTSAIETVSMPASMAAPANP